jgi:hypothetical protein
MSAEGLEYLINLADTYLSDQGLIFHNWELRVFCGVVRRFAVRNFHAMRWRFERQVARKRPYLCQKLFDKLHLVLDYQALDILSSYLCANEM